MSASRRRSPSLEAGHRLCATTASSSVAYDGRRLTFTGPWPAGPDPEGDRGDARAAPGGGRTSIPSMPRRCAIATGRSCSSAASRTTASRWARSRPAGAARCSSRPRRPSSTTTGTAVMGSKEPFLKRRTQGTERADKAAPEAKVAKFFGEMPTWQVHDDPTGVDVVVLPTIDGNLAPSTGRADPVRARVPDPPLAPELPPPQRAPGTGHPDAARRHGRPPPGAGRLRPSLLRPAVLLRASRHAAGAAGRGRPGPLRSRCGHSRSHSPRTSPRPSRSWPASLPRASWRAAPT